MIAPGTVRLFSPCRDSLPAGRFLLPGRGAGTAQSFLAETRRRFVAPAALLELPRGWIAVTVSVSPSGVTVERVGLFASLSRAQTAA